MGMADSCVVAYCGRMGNVAPDHRPVIRQVLARAVLVLYRMNVCRRLATAQVPANSSEKSLAHWRGDIGNRLQCQPAIAEPSDGTGVRVDPLAR
jgi:hypothetical protein